MFKKYEKPQLIGLDMNNARGACSAGSTPGTNCSDGGSATGDCITNGGSASSACTANGSVVSNYCTFGSSAAAYCQTGDGV